jgi:PAS domain S-box-containing protein
MDDRDKTREQLLGELEKLRQQVATMQTLEAERKRTEETLRKSQEKYRSVLDSIEEGYFELDLSGNFTFFNDAVCKAFGYSREELMGMNNRDYTTPETAQKMYDIFNQIYRTGKPAIVVDYEIIRKDGSRMVLELSASLKTDSQGQPVGFQGVGRDVSARSRAEEELRESEERYRTVLEANPDPVVVYDIEGMVVYFNPAFAEVFGWNLEDRVGKKMDLFVPEENWPETQTMINKVLAGESFSGVETRRYTKTGDIIPVSVSGAIYRDRDGNPVGSVINLRNIREQKELEAQLQHAQKMEAVGTLAGGIAHDFNNLLQAVQGYAELLLRGKTGDEREFPAMQKILRAARRGAELTRQLLTFGRKVESKKRPLDLNSEIQETRRLLERTIPKMIEIELQLTDDSRTINADPVQIEQLLMNLAVNAKDAMPAGGKLTVSTANITLDEDYCQVHPEARPGDYVLLTVADTGHGMDQDTLEHIFDPFYTTKEVGKGTGLGLSMVYGIVKNHEGYITCTSEPGVGTTFSIYLPSMDLEGDRTGEESVESPMPGGRETILIVEDEESIRELGVEVFGNAGYTVHVTADGESALEFYRDKGETIDLIILDLIMPGMGGLRCLEELLRLNPKARILIASGYPTDDDTAEAVETGAKGFVRKPYKTDHMLRAVRQVLDND